MCEPDLDGQTRYLVIDSRTGGDWSLDLIFAGLVDMYGPMMVYDFPMKEKHREWSSWRDPTNDWGRERRTLGYTSMNRGVSSDPQEIRGHAIKGRLLVFMDERDESHEIYYRLFGGMRVPVVIVAGHDRFWNVSPEHVIRKFAGQLKRLFIDNWREEYDSLPLTSLINWSANFDHYWDPTRRRELLADKRYDICFYGYNSHPDRARFIDFIESHPVLGKLNNKIFLERRPDTLGDFIPKAQYFETMAMSKVCLNLRGAAEQGKTLRFLEIPYVGSFMLSQDFPDRQLFPFVNGTHCRYFSDESELEEILIDCLYPEDYIATPSAIAMDRIAAAGHAHLMGYHSVKARIRYVMHEVNHGS